MADLNIRGVPTDIVRRAKARAAYLGKTLRQWIIDLISKEIRSPQ